MLRLRSPGYGALRCHDAKAAAAADPCKDLHVITLNIGSMAKHLGLLVGLLLLNCPKFFCCKRRRLLTTSSELGASGCGTSGTASMFIEAMSLLASGDGASTLLAFVLRTLSPLTALLIMRFS